MTKTIRGRQIVAGMPFVLMTLAQMSTSATLAKANLSVASKPDANQSSDAPVEVPKYEVSTIKPGTGDGRIMLMFTPDGVSIAGVPMQMILREAFGTEDDRIVGAPAWVKSTKYDIQAKVDPADAPKLDKLKMDERRSMLVPLLVDRFNLKYHHETRVMPLYALIIAKGGLKMRESKPDDPAENDGHGQHMLRYMGRGHIESTGTGAPLLARILSEQLGRSVVDKTGLAGNYDFTLQWTPDDAPPPGPGGAGGAGGGPPRGDDASDAVGPSLFTAVQEQLGLKLESDKGPMDVIVIDHIDLPSAN
jgi:bla regulator protein blaR1